MYAHLNPALPLSTRSRGTKIERTASRGIFQRWAEALFNVQYADPSALKPSAFAALTGVYFPEREVAYSVDTWVQGEGKVPAALSRYRALYEGEALSNLEDRYLEALIDVQEAWTNGNTDAMARAFGLLLSLVEAHLAYHAGQFEDHEIRHLLPVPLMVAHGRLYRHPELLRDAIAVCAHLPVLHTYLPALKMEEVKATPYDSRTWLPVEGGAVSLLRQYRVQAMGKPLFELHETYQAHRSAASQARLNRRPCDAFEALSALLPLVEAELAYTKLRDGVPADLSWELNELSELCVMQEKADVLLDLNLVVHAFEPLHGLHARVEGAWIMRDVAQSLRATFAVQETHSVEDVIVQFPHVERKWVEHTLRILGRCGKVNLGTLRGEALAIPQNVFTLVG